MTRSWSGRLVAAVVLALLLVSCTGGGGDADGTSEAAAPDASIDASGFPLSIEHMLGSIELERPPERVVALGTADADIAVALGTRPVAIVAASNGDGLPSPWLREQFDLEGIEVLPPVESGELSIERVLALRPDLVLATTAFGTIEAYEQLTAAGVPVLVARTGYFEDSWQDLTRTIGSALGRDAAAEELVAATEASIAEVAAAHPNLRGATFVVGLDRGTDGFNVLNDPANFSVQIFTELGMHLSPRLVDEVGVAPTAGGIQISSERADLLEADAVFMTAATGVGRDPSEHPLLKDQTSVRAGTFVSWPSELAAGIRVPSPLSIPYVLEQVDPTLGRITATG